MAARTRTNKLDGAKFMAAVLAPISAGTEQVDTKAERRAILDDMNREWRAAWLLMRAAHYDWLAADLRAIHAVEVQNKPHPTIRSVAAECETDRWKTHDALMQVPAPTIGALRWKQKSRAYNGGRAEWDEAISVDVTRLEPNAGKMGGR